MAYTSWSVIYGEQPSAAKWNILGTNDASFNDGTGIDAGVVLPNHLLAAASSLNTWGWDSWVPTFANFTKDTSTIVAKYTQIGKTIHYRLCVTLAGASVAMGTLPTFTLPVTSVTYGAQYENTIGIGRAVDANSTDFTAYVLWNSTTTGCLFYDNGTGGGATFAAAAPFTWVVTDSFAVTGTYEAA